MTTEQLDHLRLLESHLEGLLAKASKRTPGEWKQDYIYVDTNNKHVLIKADGGPSNAAYIAACAGNAEAGWRSTLGVIKRYYDSEICRQWQGYMQTAIEPILAEWPLESLKTN